MLLAFTKLCYEIRLARTCWFRRCTVFSPKTQLTIFSTSHLQLTFELDGFTFIPSPNAWRNLSYDAALPTSCATTAPACGSLRVGHIHRTKFLIKHHTPESQQQVGTRTSSEALQARLEQPVPVPEFENETPEPPHNVASKTSGEVAQATPKQPMAVPLLKNETFEPPQYYVATNTSSEGVQTPPEQPSVVPSDRNETPAPQHEETANKSTEALLVPPEHESNTSWVWENAGGEFGLSADWQKAILVPGSGDGIRGDRCLNSEHQDEVRKILARRDSTPPTEKVLCCIIK